MIKELIKLANDLDNNGLVREADYLDKIIKSAWVEVPRLSAEVLNTFKIIADEGAKGLLSREKEIKKVLSKMTPKQLANLRGMIIGMGSATAAAGDAGAYIRGVLKLWAGPQAWAAAKAVGTSSASAASGAAAPGAAASGAAASGAAASGSAAAAGAGTIAASPVIAAGIILIGLAAAGATVYHGWKAWEDGSDAEKRATANSVKNAITLSIADSIKRRKKLVKEGGLDAYLATDIAAYLEWRKGRQPSEKNFGHLLNQVTTGEWRDHPVEDDSSGYTNLDKAKAEYRKLVSP